MTIMINPIDELNYIDEVGTNFELLFFMTLMLLSGLISCLIIKNIIKKVMEEYL